MLADRCGKGEAQPDNGLRRGTLQLFRSCWVDMPLAKEIALVEALVALEFVLLLDVDCGHRELLFLVIHLSVQH